MGLGLGSGWGDGGGSGHRAKSSSAGPELGGTWLGWWGEKEMPKIQCSHRGVTGSAKDKRTHQDCGRRTKLRTDRRTDSHVLRPVWRLSSHLLIRRTDRHWAGPLSGQSEVQ